MSVWDPMSERPYHGWLHDGARVPVPVHSGRKPRLAGPLIALAFKGVTQMIIFLLVLIFLATCLRRDNVKCLAWYEAQIKSGSQSRYCQSAEFTNGDEPGVKLRKAKGKRK